ncbi:MAG: TetR/AcrR family transcriptional regulator [Spirochaetaceae bacterium]
MPYRETARSRARKEQMHSRILREAVALFRERGYEATGMREIAAAAGTSVGNCYFYFADKEALLLAAVDAVIADISTEADAAGRAEVDGGPKEQARALVTAGMQAALKRPVVTALMLSEAARIPVRERIRTHFTARTVRFFAAHPELTGAASPEVVAAAWQGTILSVLERYLTGDLDYSSEGIAAFTAEWNLAALTSLSEE